MNGEQHLMTYEEAAEWKFCEVCGTALEEEVAYRYAYDTGERYEDSRMRMCPKRSMADPHHTFIELVGDPVEAVA